MEDYKKAGDIASQALLHGKKLIKPGASIMEILDQVESKIHDLGGNIAFPAQISLNQVAAHFCPTEANDVILSDELVKLDVGVHINGMIGDNALSVDLSKEHEDLVKASREALNAAIKIIQPELEIREIGKEINQVISSYDFNPVRNLSGHGLGEFQIHTYPSIPNYDNGSTEKLTENQVIAIEPFATTGEGFIKESVNPTLFSLRQHKPVRNPITRNIYNFIVQNYQTLPFTERWLYKLFSPVKVKIALRDLIRADMLNEFPPLPERTGGLVSQAEHTVIVKDKPFITTNGTNI